jgi:hypothetical protein
VIKDKKRKEVSLDPEILSVLEFQAKKQGRNLKNYLEFILTEKANSFELSDEYKKMMDEVLEQKEKGNLSFLNEEEFRYQTKREV